MPEAPPSACVDPDTAASYAEQGLSPDERLAVERHIDGCPSCRELISMMAKTREASPTQTGSGMTDAAALGGVLPRGTKVGHFEIDRPLDAGGMGLVYSAHDTRLNRKVALKCVRERRGHSDQLLREARMMAQLAHPNVVPVYDVVDARGQIFLAMELVVGSSVRQWLQAQPRSWKAVVDAFVDGGAGLAAAHAADIVHGDVKPANILFGDDGRVRVTDFGLSSLTTDEAGADEGPKGTPAYMAPEQLAGKPCDARGDQYAFCVSLHEALFGALPGTASVKRVPRSVRRILERGLSADPAARYPSMLPLLRGLKATRSSTWTFVGIAAVLTIGTVALAYDVGGRRVETTMCAAADPRLTAPWDAEARGVVRRAFANTKLSYVPHTLERVEANLDKWTSSFEAARRQACETGWFAKETPLERFSAQLSCLEDRAREVRALVSQFRVADAVVVLNAIGATEQLTPLGLCSTAPSPRVLTPDSEAVQQVREKLARVHALMDSGKFRDAMPVNEELLKAAEAVADPSLHSAALVSIGANYARLSDYEKAAASLLQGLRLAEGAQDDRVRAQAWVSLIQSEYWRGHYEQVVFMKEPALGSAERVGDLWLKTEMLLMLGGSLSQLGRIAEAQPLFEEAVWLRKRQYGEKDRRLAFALSSLGNAYSMQGNLDAGIVAHRQAVVTAEAALGESHPNVGILHNNLGDDFLYGLDPTAAIAEFEKGAKILEAANGPKHRDVALSLTELGHALFEAGQLQRAAETFERADALWAAVSPQHPVRAQALLGKQATQEALGKPVIVAELESALTLGAKLPPFERARIQFALGRASTGPKAAALVKEAIAGFATSPLPLIQRELVRARAWQAANP